MPGATGRAAEALRAAGGVKGDSRNRADVKDSISDAAHRSSIDRCRYAAVYMQCRFWFPAETSAPVFEQRIWAARIFAHGVHGSRLPD